MQLTAPDVARLFGVSESTVARWVEDENLPAREVNAQYRFDRAELLEWATVRRKRFSPSIFQEVNGDRVAELHLADAMEAGGITSDVKGSSKQDVYRMVLDGLTLPEQVDGDSLVAMLLARERSGSTAVGNGIAVPHPRYPMVLGVSRPLVRLCYLEEPLDFSGSDGKLVDTLFVMICPTVHDHLQLLARLASLLTSDSFRALLARRAGQEEILRAVRREEEAVVSDSPGSD
ncbi:MAG: PTS sugar transporter subunit IIA [Pirellulales bacterium]